MHSAFQEHPVEFSPIQSMEIRWEMKQDELSAFILYLYSFSDQTKVGYSLDARTNIAHYHILALLIPWLSEKSETDCISDFDAINYATLAKLLNFPPNTVQITTAATYGCSDCALHNPRNSIHMDFICGMHGFLCRVVMRITWAHKESSLA